MGWKVYILVGIAGVLLSIGVYLDHCRYYDKALEKYQENARLDSQAIANILEKTMKTTYRDLRTIARLPALRTIDRSANSLTPDAQQSIQELYNNLISDVKLSELYIVPVDFEPDQIDPNTGKLQEPIVTYDKFIVGRTVRGISQADSLEESPDNEIEEIEIYEYRVMKEQLVWYRENYPTEDGIDKLDYPAITSPEIVTCDNRYFNPQAPNDSDRSGFVYSVPYYGLDGELKGCVSAVLLTRELSNLLPSSSYAVRNTQHQYTVEAHKFGLAQQSLKFVQSCKPDPNLIYSEVINLEIVDGSGQWLLWAGFPNTEFFKRSDVQHSRQAMVAKYLGAFVLTIGLWLVLFLVNKNQHLVATQNRNLEQQVKERTAKLAASETRTNAILHSAADAIVTMDQQGIISTFNRAAETIFGYEASEIIGFNVSKLLPHKDDHDNDIKEYMRTGTGGLIDQEREINGHRKDGSSVQLAIRLTETIDQSERWFVGIMQEITERKRLETELEALARIPEENPSPIMRLSRHAKVLYANPASKAILASWGIADGENLGSWWLKQVSQTLENTDYRDVEYEQDGSIYEFRLTPILKQDYVNIWGYDITDRKRAEAQREELHRELQANTEQLEKQKAQLVEEIDQRMGSEATARHDATHDTLTGLSNRAMLMEHVEESLKRSQVDSSYKFALLFLDFDRFKLVNDSLGHEVGDQLLISIADRLKKNLRSDDLAQTIDESKQERNIPTRLGGDEFVVLLDHVSNINDAIQVAERLQKALEEPHKLGAHEVTSTASIGIVISDNSYNSADEMLRDADTAMYSAKAAGKAQHKVFDKTMHDQANDRLQLENDLRTALQKEQFRILYQPIVELETGQIIGFEALIRWEHPTRGLISPMDFIPVAEETGLIVPIGGWVLLEATQQLKKWQTQFPRKEPLSMNVNISKRQLTQPNLVSTIQNVLRSVDIPAYTLKLEVTESAIMSDMEQLTPILHSLRSLGLHLCIDDFGTGQSSLSCLHMFAVDVLKIDRYFLENMGESREYAAVTQAIVTLAHNLGMEVVAEGVETADQVAQLQALEADLAQGYFFARPIKPDQIEALLQNSPSLARSAA